MGARRMSKHPTNIKQRAVLSQQVEVRRRTWHLTGGIKAWNEFVDAQRALSKFDREKGFMV